MKWLIVLIAASGCVDPSVTAFREGVKDFPDGIRAVSKAYMNNLEKKKAEKRTCSQACREAFNEDVEIESISGTTCFCGGRK